MIQIKMRNEHNLRTIQRKCKTNLWHRRLGHLNNNGLRILNLLVSDEKCTKCIEGKGTRQPFKLCKKRSKRIGDLIHSDIGGPIAESTSEGYVYYQVIINDFSHFTIVKLLKTKNEATQNLID